MGGDRYFNAKKGRIKKYVEQIEKKATESEAEQSPETGSTKENI
ncbi:hypothetical protein GCM10022410_11220 [Amphibacillus indicireducens]|uniref:Uncharacterized protein n=1 Tax=Amphibacillus indicireducens TaxID=1076330 RepID=A0ABP7VGT2_9BACI